MVLFCLVPSKFTSRDPGDLFQRWEPAPDKPTAMAVKGFSSGLVRGVDLEIRAGEVLGIGGLAGQGLSARVTVPFLRQLVHTLTPEQRVIYDDLARAWQFVLSHRDETMARTNAAMNLPGNESAGGPSGIFPKKKNKPPARKMRPKSVATMWVAIFMVWFWVGLLL